MPAFSLGGAAALAAGGSFGAGIGGSALLGAGVGVFGDVLGGLMGQSTNAQQMQLANAQMAFQKDLATHAMQYRVQDLREAGLNPMLAVSGGGAQAMPGSMAQLQNPGLALQNAGGQVTSALQLQTQQAQIQQMQSQSKLMDTQATKTSGADTELAQAQAKLADNTREVLQPAQAQAARAAAQLDDSSRQRVDQQINSGDIAASIRLMGQQTGAAAAQRYMDMAIGQLNQMNAIESQYAMPLVFQKMGLELQKMELSLPELRAMAGYFETKAGQQLFLQRQIESGVSTAAGAASSFIPRGGAGPGPMPGVNTTPGFTLGAGSPRWPVNP